MSGRKIVRVHHPILRNYSTSLLTEYAFFLTPGGILYTITDVEALYEWHVAKCDAHPCFERLSDEEMVKETEFVYFKDSGNNKCMDRKKMHAL